ncbi:MAG: hypothetical protein KDA45_12495 [Planctomycetales bacterium]|nr:hypothetical protein [Planctomycetales bacterium]
MSASLASFHSSLLPSYQGLVAHTARPAAVLAQWLEQSSMVWSELQAVQPLRHVLSPDAGLPPSPAHSLSSLRFSAAQQSWCVSRPDPGRAPRPAAKTAKQPIAAHKSLLVASPLAGQAPRPRTLAKNTATAPAKITPLAMPQHFSAGYLPADLGSCDWQGNQPLLHSTRTAPHRGSQVPAELAATAALGQNVGDAGPASSHRAVAQASTGSWLWLKSVQPSTMDRWVKQSLSTTSHHLRWQASKQLENAGQAMLQISRYLAPVAESKMAHADSDALR